MPGTGFAISHTTRPPRPGEVHGKDYHFVSREEFERMDRDHEFLEWAEVYGNLYGSSKASIEDMLLSGTDVLHDVDVQGARSLKKVFPSGVFIFILPPSPEALEQRLRGRASDAEEVIKRRLGQSLSEISDYILYDYVIINDTLDEALVRFKALVTARRLRCDNVDPEWVKKTFFP